MRPLTTILADVECDYSLSPLWGLFEWLEAKVERSGLDSLTKPGRAIFLAQRYDGGMAQGGFDTLLRWDRTLGVMPMITALREVGASQTADVLAGLALQFPSGAIPDAAGPRCQEYDEYVLPREREMERLWENLRCAERAEDVCLLCLAHARDNLTELRAEGAEPDR